MPGFEAMPRPAYGASGASQGVLHNMPSAQGMQGFHQQPQSGLLQPEAIPEVGVVAGDVAVAVLLCGILIYAFEVRHPKDAPLKNAPLLAWHYEESALQRTLSSHRILVASVHHLRK